MNLKTRGKLHDNEGKRMTAAPLQSTNLMSLLQDKTTTIPYRARHRPGLSRWSEIPIAPPITIDKHEPTIIAMEAVETENGEVTRFVTTVSGSANAAQYTLPQVAALEKKIVRTHEKDGPSRETGTAQEVSGSV